MRERGERERIKRERERKRRERIKRERERKRRERETPVGKNL